MSFHTEDHHEKQFNPILFDNNLSMHSDMFNTMLVPALSVLSFIIKSGNDVYLPIDSFGKLAIKSTNG